MRINTDSFNCWHNHSLLNTTAIMRSFSFLLIWWFSTGKKVLNRHQNQFCLWSLDLSDAVLLRSFSSERWSATAGESFDLPLTCSTYTHTHSYTLFVAPLSKSLCRLFGNLLLEVKEELIVRQGRLCSVLDHVLHKAGLPLALIPARVNHRKKKKKKELYHCISFLWQLDKMNSIII